MKSITALEIQTGDKVQIKGQDGLTVEMWIDAVRVKDSKVTVWGSWVIDAGASDHVILVEKNWGEK